MTERKPPPRGITCLIKSLRNSDCLADSFNPTREDDARFGTVRLKEDSLVGAIARAERSIPRGRVTTEEHEVWLLQRGDYARTEKGEQDFIETLEDYLGGEIPSFLGLSPRYGRTVKALLDLLGAASGGAAAGSGRPSGGFLGGGYSGFGGASSGWLLPSGGDGGGTGSGWIGDLLSGLSGFLGGVSGRTGFLGWIGYEYDSGPNSYGGKTTSSGNGFGDMGGMHAEKVYDSAGNLREQHSYTIGSDGSWWAERHTYFNEDGKKTGGSHEHHDVEQEELAEAAWNWFGGDDSDSGSDSMSVDDGSDEGRRRVPPDIAQVRLAWEMSDELPFDEDDIAHLPIDPASGERSPTEATGVGFVVVGRSTDEEDPGDDEMTFPGAGLGVPRSTRREYEPSIWYQVFVVDPPELGVVIQAADRRLEQAER